MSPKSRLRAWLQNDWVITLVATMVGVFVGIYLNGVYDQRKLDRSKEEALRDVQTELIDNLQILTSWDSVMSRQFVPFTQLAHFMEDAEGETIVHMRAAQMDSFQRANPDFLVIKDTEPLTEKTNRYHVEVEMDLNSPLVLLPENQLTWEAFKSTEYINHLDFGCIKYIASIYQLLAKSREHRTTWIEHLAKQGPFQAEDRKTILYHWRMEQSLNRIIIGFEVDELPGLCE